MRSGTNLDEVLELRFMAQTIGCIAVVVRDYDEAIAYFTGVLGFELVENSVLSDAKRWVLVAPLGSRETKLLLAKAATPDQTLRVGDQTGGRVFLFLQTDDFWRDYQMFGERGVRFCGHPREETYGTVIVFEDLFGNKWDLVQRR
jgi:catechol 2,3-dioxygenase-like lactoylglutathione lyase family enzyme